MQGPPKPKNTPDDLAEVERALSVLKGRHPEHERARREDEEARSRRRASMDAAANVESKRRSSRVLVMGVVTVTVLAAAGVVSMLVVREIARGGRVEKAIAPYRAMGFEVVETSSRSKPGMLDLQAPQGCLLAVSSNDKPIKVERVAGTTEGAGPVLFCMCESERVAVSTDPGDGGLALLSIDAASLGGSRAFAFSPLTSGTKLVTDQACAETSLDAWIDAKKFPVKPADDKWLTAKPARAPLARSGFKVVATVPPAAPFAVVDLAKESCLLAVADEGATKLALRGHGGTALASSGLEGVAYCTAGEVTVSVEREGQGEVTILSAPATRVGGTEGLEELAHEVGLKALASAPPADLAWNAKQLLVASAVPEALVTTTSAPDVVDSAEARVFSLSFKTPGAIAPEAGEDVFSYCEPTLGPNVLESLCLFSGPSKWRISGPEAVGGIARSKLPFWLLAMQGVNDPVALKEETQLFALARHLKYEGFEPTTLEALTELPNGVEILGRAGEDAVVAVSVAPEAPYVIPLTDGAAWATDGPPRIVPLAPLAKVTLTTGKKSLPSKNVRRTVVFRRQKK
ncbi:hypothetical protein AKJ09_05158 [Labilithrix luteola]|uniref:Uncharacterized protein n=1 Tax=Labilithrix luteola TaxID=1391654 RepID=A0A0K1PZB2_9BACT|nr:hypothetical protein [Labilithrix luteola]AKU98494.1 hypothetical protein AKJ09_05158 [Labilithrix luteola]